MSIPVKLIVFLVIGTFLMGIPILWLSQRYGIKYWKATMLTIVLTITGTIGTLLMYWIENGYIGGISFYGAVFFVPIAFLFISPVLKIKYKKAMDLCAVGECIMLALMKIHCIMGGCCIGRVLFINSDGIDIRFPSRIAEMIFALVIFTVLFYWAIKNKHTGELYVWYLILYGCVRFILNIFREVWVEKEMPLPYGNIWSLISVLIGIIALVIINNKEKKQQPT